MTINTNTRARQKYGTGCLHHCPTYCAVIIRCPVVGRGSETETARSSPLVRQKYIAVLPVHCCLTAQVGSIRSGVEQIIPLLISQRPPLSGNISLNHRTPVILGACDIALALVVRIAVVGRSSTGHIRLLAVVSACSPAEKVYHSFITATDIAVGGTYVIILMVSQAPISIVCVVLQVAGCKLYLLAFGIDGELTR